MSDPVRNDDVLVNCAAGLKTLRPAGFDPADVCDGRVLIRLVALRKVVAGP